MVASDAPLGWRRRGTTTGCRTRRRGSWMSTATSSAKRTATRRRSSPTSAPPSERRRSAARCARRCRAVGSQPSSATRCSSPRRRPPPRGRSPRSRKRSACRTRPRGTGESGEFQITLSSPGTFPSPRPPLGAATRGGREGRVAAVPCGVRGGSEGPCGAGTVEKCAGEKYTVPHSCEASGCSDAGRASAVQTAALR